MAEIKPYKISIPDAALADLRDRLARTRWPDELDGAGREMGAPLAEVRRLAEHWASGAFDWRATEARLNALPQFTTEVEVDGFGGLEVHFLHVRSAVVGAVPLLFVHGWPGSFYEGTKLIEPLTKGAGDGGPAFHLVIPSLPNFGFSQGTSKRGFALAQHAETLHKLMQRLGYDEYATQGGDWGYFITRAMSLRYAPRHLKAQHLNFDYYEPPSLTKNPLLTIRAAVTPWTRRDRDGMARTRQFEREGSGYGLVHSTRPQTIGYALADSPAALLAWVYEKLVAWTDAYPWSDDEVCTWVAVYWFARAGPAASVRLYYEFAETQRREEKGEELGAYEATPARLRAWHDVKVGLAHFPKDCWSLPGLWGRTMGDVVFERYHEDGGHFPAWERPGALVADLRAMFGRDGGARGVVEGAKL